METTITMSFREYGKMENKISDLKEKDINNFVKCQFTDLEKNEYKVVINMEKIYDYIQQIHGAVAIEKGGYRHTEVDSPISLSSLGTRRECLDCGEKGRTKLQQEVICCPSCKGLYIDVHIKEQMRKILEVAGYKKITEEHTNV